MKLKEVFLGLLVLVLSFNRPAPVQAQGGCPAVPPATETMYTVMNSYQLSPYIPEASSTKVPSVFYRKRLEGIVIQPEEAVLLASDPTGERTLCADDKVRLKSSTGAMFGLSFPSRDRTRIELQPVQNLSPLLSVGQISWVEIELIDELVPKLSASEIWLVIVKVDPNVPLPPPVSVSPRQPIVQAPVLADSQPAAVPVLGGEASTPEPQVLLTPMPTIEATPTADTSLTTSTEEAVVGMVMPTNPLVSSEPLLSIPAEEPKKEVVSSGWPTWLILLSGAGIALVVGLAMKAGMPSGSSLQPGEVVGYKDGVFQFKVDWGKFKKNVVRFGSGPVEINLPDPKISKVAARLVGQKGEEGQRQAVWEVIDPEALSEVLERYVLEHGDVHFIGDYKLVFHLYEAEPSFVEGSLRHA